MRDVIPRSTCFCLRCYWDSIKSYFTVFYYCNLSTYDQNVTTTDIGLQSTLNTHQAFLFSRYDVITCKSKQIIRCALSDVFFYNCLIFDVPQYSNRLDYITDRRRAVYFNNQKSLHITFKGSTTSQTTNFLTCSHLQEQHIGKWDNNGKCHLVTLNISLIWIQLM